MAESEVVVVAGGSGGIGEGIVAALLAAGYRVYVPTRAGDHSRRLKDYLGDPEELRLIPADLGDEEPVAALAESIRPDAGVLSIMAAAQKMMARVIAHEAFDSAVRVYALTAHTTIRTRSRGSEINDSWIDARDLGDYVVGLLKGTVPGSHDTLHELEDIDHVKSLLKRSKTGA